MKLLSFAVPCYNSEAYMEKCIESLLPGGKDVEILIVDDGSSDRTAEIADAYAERYPGIIRAIHQPNGGHGAAVNTGLKNAAGIYFKVVDSDDWLDRDSYLRVLKRLRTLIKLNTLPDMFLANYVYEKEGSKHKKVMRQKGFPKEKMFGWDDVGHLAKGHYILMHSVIYRTQMLHDCGLQLPEHTFYVDNIYVYKPLPYVKNMYYMDVDLYRYYIGREDQSVNEQTMIRRIDQQIRVNKIMFADVNLLAVKDKKCRRYMFNYLEIVTTITVTLAILSGTKENLNKRDELWSYMKQTDRQLYNKLHHSVISRYMNLPGRTGRFLGKVAYRISRKVYGFN
ncbi:MAG: glycosyltransferase family A protein [Eubacteriales bacterium]|nr:glycosyltransferase family A protein [Eubacteriales bacterium]